MDGNGCGNVGGEVVQLSVLIEAEHFDALTRHVPRSPHFSSKLRPQTWDGTHVCGLRLGRIECPGEQFLMKDNKVGGFPSDDGACSFGRNFDAL